MEAGHERAARVAYLADVGGMRGALLNAVAPSAPSADQTWVDDPPAAPGPASPPPLAPASPDPPPPPDVWQGEVPCGRWSGLAGRARAVQHVPEKAALCFVCRQLCTGRGSRGTVNVTPPCFTAYCTLNRTLYANSTYLRNDSPFPVPYAGPLTDVSPPEEVLPPPSPRSSTPADQGQSKFVANA